MYGRGSWFCNPAGLLVDKNGDLWVADRGNGRVLRFATPFSQTGQPLANLVLGQSSFYTKVTDATSSTMASPYGLAMTYDAGGKVNGSLLVSDQSLNRVLVFDQVNGAFSNGQAASKVIGQPDFRASATGSDFTSFSAPHHIAVDTDNRLYVADTGNSRVSIFDSLNRLPQADASAALNITGLSAPQALYVSAITGDIWVGQVGNGRATRYPRYDQLFVGATSNYTLQLPSSVLALTQDQFGALFTADGANRVAFYFPQLAAQNAANFLSTSQQALAPGMIATLYPFQGTQFNGVVTTDNGGKLPLPNVLADTQVLFNGVATPLFYVSSSQINFYVPMRDSAGNPTPTTGFLDVQVVRKSTGQVLGAGLIPMAPTAPALFMNPPGQTGPSRLAAIINDDDGTVNSQTNPAKRGSYISLWGTGQGFIANAPPDGTASTGIVNADPKFDLKVFLGSDYLDCNGCAQGNGEIQYSGLAPGYVGLWQINIKIPPLVGTGTTSAQALIVRLNNVYSAGLNLMGFNTVVYVK
ncbi:MAG: hypothetical protein LAQ30_22745 [Acidobacteriia bacterium]|nr:hypothetical protein [Terriglobia bacterium]